MTVGRKRAPEPTRIRPNEVVRDLEELLHRLMGEDVQVRTVLEPTAWSVLADTGQLGQALLALCSNARDAMPRGGDLTIRTTNATLEERGGPHPAELEPGDYVTVEVEDTGLGIEAEVLERIFEPFFSTREGRSGLGLTTVYRGMRDVAGAIHVESAPGRGTAVRLYLPRHPGVEVPEVATPPAPPREARKKVHTILVVEDDDSVRRTISRTLEAAGYEVRVARGGEDALALASAYRGELHLLLTDVIMPGMTGPSLADRVQTWRPSVRVLYMSGYGDRSEVQDLLSIESALLPKPFTARQLLDEVERVLA